MKIDPDPWTWFMSPFGSIFWRIFCNSSILICSGAGSLPLLRFISWSRDSGSCHTLVNSGTPPVKTQNWPYCSFLDSGPTNGQNSDQSDFSPSEGIPKWSDVFKVNERSNVRSNRDEPNLGNLLSFLFKDFWEFLLANLFNLTSFSINCGYTNCPLLWDRVLVRMRPRLPGREDVLTGTNVIDPCLIDQVQVQINQLAFPV